MIDKYSANPLSFGRTMLIITQRCSSWNASLSLLTVGSHAVTDLISNGKRSSFCPPKVN